MELSHVFVLIFIRFSSCERRIIDGQEVTTDKRYMVYLIKTEWSSRKYDTWLCGGAIISPWFVLTSAACVEDVQYIYVIAGYEKYVKITDLDTDKCTKNTKRKIVTTCVPEAYNLTYDKLEKWSHLDIAIVKVEYPYKFDDKSFNEHCSYMPNKIPINFDTKYEKAGVDAIMLGWGHTKKWRKIDDKTDYNQKKLHYASTKIFNKEDCKTYFKKPDLSSLIDNYMVCTYHQSHLNDRGEMIQRKHVNSMLGYFTEENATERNGFRNNDKLISSLRTFNPTRRQGICQNDHGGPLVTWVKGEEQVIGVASVFRVNGNSECIPPYLFTSTAQNKIFIQCVLKQEIKGRRSSICDKPASEKGFNILRRHISWSAHPDGSTQNGAIHRRPQTSINRFGA